MNVPLSEIKLKSNQTRHQAMKMTNKINRIYLQDIYHALVILFIGSNVCAFDFYEKDLFIEMVLQKHMLLKKSHNIS